MANNWLDRPTNYDIGTQQWESPMQQHARMQRAALGGGSPDGTDPDAGEADFQRILRTLGYDKPAPMPQRPASPGMRTPRIPLGFGLGIPSIPISGRILDSIADAAATTPPPANMRGATGIGASFAQGFAQARGGAARGRQEEYEAQAKQAGDFNSAAQRFKEQAALRMMTARGGSAPKSLEDIEAEAAARSRGTHSVSDPSLVASREALTAERLDRQQTKKTQAADDEAMMEDFAEKVATFRIKPDDIPKRDPRWNAAVQARIDNKLFAKGSPYSLQQLDQLWRNTRKWLDTSNAQRAVNTRKAAMTVLDHISQFEESMDKYREAYERLPNLKKLELRISNKGVYGAALNGLLGPDAAADAAALEAVVQILPTEYATVLSGGFAPQKEQLEEARKVFNVAMGPQGHKGRTAAVRRLVKARVGNEQKNFSMIGGENNPYLMEISKLEGWDLDKPLEPAAKKKGGFFDD